MANRMLVVMMALSAALVAGCVVGEGPVVSETREVRTFDRIEAGSGIHVSMRIGPAQDLEVRGQENVLGAITTDVEGGTLKIEARDDFTSVEPVTVTIVAPALAGISMSGGAQATIEGLDATSLEIDIRGGARATVIGAAATVELKADGGAVAELGDLAAVRMTIDVAGGASATVSASEGITGAASGGSTLTVLGDAEVDVQTSGGAEVTRE
jgi:hypothetical protein